MEDEFDAITALRNAPGVRPWFLDDRPLDPTANRNWLARGMRRPAEGLLSIRVNATGWLLGTIGWSRWSPEQRTADFGRLALARRALAQATGAAAVGLRTVALEATIALRDFAFERMELERITTSYIAGNSLGARVNERVGMVIDCQVAVQRPDGSWIEMVELSLDRARWRTLR